MSDMAEGPGWWLASDGKWYAPNPPPSERPPPPQVHLPPPPLAYAPVSGGVLFAIGDIGVSQEWIITPNGTAPLAGSQWIVQDMTRTEDKIPQWAIVCGIIFTLLFLIGFVFFFVREKRMTGYVDVNVRSDNLFHACQIPVYDQFQVQRVRQMVGQAQSLAAQRR